MTATTSRSSSTKIDPRWVEFVCGGADGRVDVLGPTYCGAWAIDIEHDPGLGWLAFDHAGDDRRPSDEQQVEAIIHWLAGNDLPRGFLRFDRTAAARAWRYGIQRWGPEWYVEGVRDRYDAAVQYAVLGAVLYM